MPATVLLLLPIPQRLILHPLLLVTLYFTLTFIATFIRTTMIPHLSLTINATNPTYTTVTSTTTSASATHYSYKSSSDKKILLLLLLVLLLDYFDFYEQNSHYYSCP